MERLIAVVNRLQQVFAELDLRVRLDLPQIAVVGGQSAGKSSVLENFVGRDFLPRGTGIVTRRPLVLQLVNSKHEYGTFVHCKGKTFTDFNEIRKEIEEETNRFTGSNKEVSNVPIHLRIFSPNVLNLTLIDLPGMTKVPVGNQPKDIEAQIRSMIYSFINQKNCLILAVTPANQDLVNSDALKIAKEVDPEGMRTIGVITKLDLMDEGTDARNILENKFVPLARGYIGVVNRSQKDIDGNKDIKASIEAEKKFFSEHPSYQHMADRLGTPYLQTVLNEQLTNHIRNALPSIRSKLQKKIFILEKDIGDIDLNDPNVKTKIMLQTLQQFKSDYELSIEGTYFGQMNINKLSGGARINRLFHESFPLEITAGMDIDEEVLKREIAIAVDNAHGIRIGLFTPQLAFEAIVKSKINRLREPSLKCVDLVMDELSKIVEMGLEKMSKYPLLRKETERIVTTHIGTCAKLCKEQLVQLIECELSYINTNHEDFRSLSEFRLLENTYTTLEVQNVIILYKGWMSIQNQGVVKSGSKDFWFVLTPENISCFKDQWCAKARKTTFGCLNETYINYKWAALLEISQLFSQQDEKELKFVCSLDGLRIKDTGNKSLVSRRNTFTLFNPDGRNVLKDFKHLELKCETQEEADSWKASFFRAKVILENSQNTSELFVDKIRMETNKTMNHAFEKQIEIIKQLVVSYLNIVIKSCHNLFPKFIMHLIINNMKNFINEELLSHLYASNDQNKIMEESPEEVYKSKEKMRKIQAYKEALRVISDLPIGTATTPVLSPNKYDWMSPDIESSEFSMSSAKHKSVQNNLIPPNNSLRSAPVVPNKSGLDHKQKPRAPAPPVNLVTNDFLLWS